MEILTDEGLRVSGVQLDVVGSDAVVMVDTTLLASPERDKGSRTQKLSTYLSTRFHCTLAPRVAYLQTPMREAIPEKDPSQAQEPTQDEGLPHNAIERMAEAVERSMSVQQEHPIAPETGIREAFFVEIAALATRARLVVAFVEIQALDSVVKELERVVSFMRVGCPTAFIVCFEERRWLNVETVEMRQDWATMRDPSMESRVEALT